MLTLDGSMGEGGGQVLRTALALSLCLKKPFRMVNIRARRAKPGLRPQHLAAVRAAARVGAAETAGDEVGSSELSFAPKGIVAGEWHFDIGTAGSTSLVLETVLPALILADRPSSLIIEGGTHNPLAPPFEFLERAFLPLVSRMGPAGTIALDRPGFYPAGGGRIRVRIDPVPKLKPLTLDSRGSLRRVRAVAVLARLPAHIGRRELAVLQAELGLSPKDTLLREATSARGPGNAVVVIVESEALTEVFSACGERGVRAEDVALKVAGEVRRYLESGAAVGEHLADQLLLPLALAGGGSYATLAPSSHLLTNIAVVKRFLDIPIDCRTLGPDLARVSVGRGASS